MTRLDAPVIPHMGWNVVEAAAGSTLFRGLDAATRFYFVHSYAFEATEPEDVLATTDYGGPVTAIIARGNLAGLQFHVEKSGPVGLAMLANFLRWEP